MNINSPLRGNYNNLLKVMIKYFQNRFALTEKGAKDLRQGIVSSTLLNLVLMLPPTYLFFFLMEYLDNTQRFTYFCILFP